MADSEGFIVETDGSKVGAETEDAARTDEKLRERDDTMAMLGFNSLARFSAIVAAYDIRR